MIATLSSNNEDNNKKNQHHSTATVTTAAPLAVKMDNDYIRKLATETNNTARKAKH